MLRLRKNIILVLLFFVLLVSLGSKGYACVSDQVSDQRIESSEQLKIISDFISILGEGTFQGQKLLVPEAQDKFDSIDSFYITGISLFNNRYFLMEVDGQLSCLDIPFLYTLAIFLSLSTLLI